MFKHLAEIAVHSDADSRRTHGWVFVLRVDHSDSHSLRYAAFEAVWPMHTYVITDGSQMRVICPRFGPPEACRAIHMMGIGHINIGCTRSYFASSTLLARCTYCTW